MLDTYHWDVPEAHFLALMEAEVLTIAEIRELTWAQVRDSYEGITILEKKIALREEYLESIRTCLSSGKGFYDEELNGSEGSPRIFSRDTLKEITRELDQFRG